MRRIVSLKVNVPHPCTEEWEKMQPTEGGRFCNNCNKTVIDFSFMSDAEVIRIIKEYGSNLCGRYLEGQLDRELSTEKENGHSLMPAIVLSTLLTAGAAISSDAKGTSVETVQVDTTQIPPCPQADTTENLMPGYSALGQDLVVTAYSVITRRYTTGATATFYTIKGTALKPKPKRKWYQFWKRR